MGRRRSTGIRGWLLRSVAAGVALVVIGALVAGLLTAPGVGRMVGPMAGAGGDDDAGPPIDWDSGSVRLQADSLRVEAIGTFRGQPDTVDGVAVIEIESDPASPTSRTLEVDWQEQGVPMRLVIDFAADEAHWWVTRMFTYDGSRDGRWIDYPGVRFRTPLGESFVGRVEVTGTGTFAPGTLRIEGMRLTAFVPGTSPAPLQDCRMYDPEGIDVGFDLEQLIGMTAVQAGTEVRARGLCLEYRWSYRTGQDSRYSERWCVAPPRGQVSDVDPDGGVVMLFVHDDSGVIRQRREQPPAGWGCPTDDGPIDPVPSATPDVSIPMSSPMMVVPDDPMGSTGPDMSIEPVSSVVPVASPR
jgi:hypothetical protein